LSYVFRHTEDRISGVPDYLAVLRNTPDLTLFQALGPYDRFHLLLMPVRSTDWSSTSQNPHHRPLRIDTEHEECRGLEVDAKTG